MLIYIYIFRYIEFIWSSEDQAVEQAELLDQIREDMKVKHLSLKDKRGKTWNCFLMKYSNCAKGTCSIPIPILSNFFAKC